MGLNAVRLLVIVALLAVSGLPAMAQEDEDPKRETTSKCGDGSADLPSTRSTDTQSNTQPKNNAQPKKKKGKKNKEGAETSGEAKKPAKCKPAPPQVSLFNLRAPTPASTDVDLQAALAEAGFLNTWYRATPTDPRLSLLEVTGTEADAKRDDLVNFARDLVLTRERITELQAAAEQSVEQQTAVLADIERAGDRIAGLVAERGRAQATLATLRRGLDKLVGALQDTAVGLYMGSQPSGVGGVDDVDNYNVQRELVERIDLTIDELLTQREDVETRIASGVTRLSEINDAIDAQRGARSELVRQEQNIQTTIDRLTTNIADQTRNRLEIEIRLPTLITETHDARLVATSPVLGISLVTLDAYVQAAEDIPQYYPNCAIGWEMLAGIASVESDHGRFGGAVVRSNGDISRRILGPLLDGTLPDTAIIKDTDGGRLDGNKKFDAAIGPFQFIPGTWRRSGLDANEDGYANPHNLYDGALSAAGYLCTASSMTSDSGIARSVLSYNNSLEYLAAVTGFARKYFVSLALPEAAYDPTTLVVDDGWQLSFGGTADTEAPPDVRSSALQNTGG